MKLTNRQIADLADALKALDGAERAVHNKEKEFVCMERVPYQLPWKLTYAAGKTADALKGHLQVIEKCRQAIIGKYSGGKGGVSQQSEQFLPCTQEIGEMLDQEVEVSVHEIAVEWLEKANLPPGVITGLMRIIKEPALAA